MEYLNAEQYIGTRVNVKADMGSDFDNDFKGVVIGVRNGFLQVRDMDDDVWEVEVSQVTPKQHLLT